MIDYDYKDFADLIGKDHGEAIAAQRLLDAIKKLDIHFYTLLRSNIETRDSVEGIAEKTQEYIKRIEAKLETLNQNINAVEQFQDSQHEEIRLLLIQTVEKLNRVEAKLDTMEKDELVLNRLSYIADHLEIVSDRVERCFSNQVLNVSPAIGRVEAKLDHFAACWEDEMDAINRVDVKLEPLTQNVNLLIQDVRDLQKKVDAMENRLLPPGCLYIPKPEITPAGQTANVCIAGPFLVAETHMEVKSYAEKEYADNTAPKEAKP